MHLLWLAQNFEEKSWYMPIYNLHGVTTQKTITAMKTPNLISQQTNEDNYLVLSLMGQIIKCSFHDVLWYSHHLNNVCCFMLLVNSLGTAALLSICVLHFWAPSFRYSVECVVSFGVLR